MFLEFMNKPTIKSYLIIFITVFAVVPLASAGLYSYIILSRTITTHSEHYLTNNIHTINQNLDGLINTIDNTSLVLLADDRLRSFLTDEAEPETLQTTQVEKLLHHQLFFNYAWQKNIISRIYVCKNKTTYYYTPQQFFAQDEILDTVNVLFNKTENLSVDKYLIPPENNDKVFYFFRSINDFNTTKNIGRLFIEINSDKFRELTDQLLYKGLSLIIFNDSGIIFLHNDIEKIGYPIETELFMLRDSENINEITLNGGSYLVTVNKLSTSGLYSLISIPKREVFSELYSTVRFYVQMLIIIMMLCILSAYFIANRIAHPIRSMMFNIDNFKNGSFKERIPKQRYRELDELASVFNHMAHDIDRLIHDDYEKQLLIRESEIHNLHAQINPHFLFNILDTIAWNAQMEQNQNIISIVNSLGQMLRAGFSRNGFETIILADELKYIQFYINLQMHRFENRMSYQLMVGDDSLLDHIIPKFSIMPIVENAFTHGLEPKKGVGSLQIRIWDESDALYIQVIDDGIGFDASSINNMLSEEVNNFTRDSEYIGILNTHRRIQLLYGIDYGLKIKSSPGEGTQVTITLPR